MKNYEEIKKALAIGDQEISEYFHYKNRNSFNTSSKKPWIINGIEKVIERLKTKFVIISKTQAKELAEAMETLSEIAEGGLTEGEEVVLEEIRNQLNN